MFTTWEDCFVIPKANQVAFSVAATALDNRTQVKIWFSLFPPQLIELAHKEFQQETN